MTSQEMDSTVEFLNTSNFLDKSLWLTGCKIFDGLWNQPYRRFHRNLTLVLYGTEPIVSLIFFIQNFSTGTLGTLSECLTLMFGNLQAVLKMIFVYNCYKNIRMLFQTSREFRSRNSDDAMFSILINSYTKSSKIALRVLHTSYYLALSLQLSLPLISGGYRKYQLPYKFNLPFLPLDVIGYYLINYLYQVYSGWCMASLSFAVDGFFMLSVSEACLQLDVLKCRLKILGSVGCVSETNNMKTLHLNYLACLSYINKIKNLYANLVLIQFVCSCLTLCTVMYVMTTPAEVADLPKQYASVFAILTQLFFYCIFGQILTDKVHDLTTTLYNNEWYNLPLKDQKSLTIIMTRSQEDVYISALGFNLSLMNFFSIVKTAYSYYAVMREMDA